MTRNAGIHSRGMVCPSLAISLSLFCEEGAGKAGRRLRPQRRVLKVDKNAHGFDRYSQDIPAFPTQWLYGLYVLSPGKRAFLAPVVSGKLAVNVAPGSRRQDHTTSPYAASIFARRE